MEHEFFALGDFPLQKGGVVLPDAKVGYLTLGELNAARDNVVVCPTWFTGTPSDVAEVLTGENRALNPERWFIVIPNHFGGGVSSSPSNAPAPFDRHRFPHTTIFDNVVAQHRLLTEGLAIERIRLVSGWSMGACQTFAWGALHSDLVDAIGPINGAARTANFSKVFLSSAIRAITSDPDWNDGCYVDKPPVRGVRMMADIFACLALSEAFYRHEAFREFAAASSVDEFLDYFWQQYFAKFDANDMLAQLWTWLHNDLSDHADFAGDFAAALAAIRARTIISQAETDSLFPLADSRDEAGKIPNAKLRVIPTIWGHLAPYDPADQEFIDEALKDLLGED